MSKELRSNPWYPHLMACIMVSCACLNVHAGSEETVRKLIPTPKRCSLEPGVLPVVAEGRLSLVIRLPEGADEKETLAAKSVAREVAGIAGQTPKITSGLAGDGKGGMETQLVLATYGRETKNLDQVLELLDQSDRDMLADPKRSEQGYVIRSRGNSIAVVGGSAQGTLYGAMTVLQLLQRDHDNLEIPRIHIQDWPDFRYRIAENWTYTEGRVHRGRGWCYDWGDGVENYKNRVKSLFDRCLRYKINVICFSSGFGLPFSQMWNADEFPMQKELNALADQRGIKLMIGGYGVAAADKELCNRAGYPDGKEYLCLTTTNFGNCRSNDELTRRIQGRLRDYVRKTEPRFLYIHHEDADTYVFAEWLWRHRCEQCRRRWPGEEMAAATGAAGGFAHGYNAVCDAIFSVKNAESGYDASRDCIVTLVSPTYTASFESDAIWDKQLAYWREVSKLLKHKKNVCIGIREQFLRTDNNKKRIAEMAETLRQDGTGPGVFLFFVSPASIYEMGPLFVPVPAAMSKLNEGAEVAYYMCGNIFQEPQILMNAAHMWNSDSLGSIPIPAAAAECRGLYNKYAKRQADPPGAFGEGGFLDVSCQSLYGVKSGAHMQALYAMKRFPICLAQELFIRNHRSGSYYDWTPDLTATQEAITHVDAALKEADCRAENRATLERFAKCLRAGEHFCRISLAVKQLTPMAFQETTTTEELEQRAARIEEQIQTMDQYLKENFTFDWATPLGGDIGIWHVHLANTRQDLNNNLKRWTESIRAREAAGLAAASGRASLVINGDMEAATGWRFSRVTGEEQVGYADGGYVDDKARTGKRSYRIAKLPVDKVSDQWSMPQYAAWGEIEQEIAVQPGQRHAITFQVFNNYGQLAYPGLIEHQVLIDDQPRWTLDAASPKGWRSDGFFFVPTSPKVRVRLRTTDVRPVPGWSQGEGDSWWDDIKVYPIPATDK